MTGAKPKFGKAAAAVLMVLAAAAFAAKMFCAIHIVGTVGKNLGYSEIILVKRCSNYAWGIDDTVSILGADGKLYFDDLTRYHSESSLYGENVRESFTDYVLNIVGEGNAIGGGKRPDFLNALLLLTDYESDGLKLRRSSGADMGTASYYALLVSGGGAELVEIKRTGDFSSAFRDPAAEAVCMIFDMIT